MRRPRRTFIGIAKVNLIYLHEKPQSGRWTKKLSWSKRNMYFKCWINRSLWAFREKKHWNFVFEQKNSLNQLKRYCKIGKNIIQYSVIMRRRGGKRAGLGRWNRQTHCRGTQVLIRRTCSLRTDRLSGRGQLPAVPFKRYRTARETRGARHNDTKLR